MAEVVAGDVQRRSMRLRDGADPTPVRLGLAQLVDEWRAEAVFTRSRSISCAPCLPALTGNIFTAQLEAALDEGSFNPFSSPGARQSHQTASAICDPRLASLTHAGRVKRVRPNCVVRRIEHQGSKHHAARRRSGTGLRTPDRHWVLHGGLQRRQDPQE